MGQDASEGYGNFSIFSLFFLTDFSRFFFEGASRSKTSGFSPIFLLRAACEMQIFIPTT